METVLLSVNPKHVANIFSGKKTIELRKTRPHYNAPFRVLIYCTYGNMKENYALGYRGRVCAEFICDNIDFYGFDWIDYTAFGKKEYIGITENKLKKMCLSIYDIEKYALKNGHKECLFGWYISNLKIYDKPKEISEFYKPCSQSKNLNCDLLRKHNICACSNKRFLTRPPQSWCYVD